MDKNNAKNVATKVGGALLTIAGIGIGGMLLVYLADIATAWWVFNRMSTAMAARGVDSNLANCIGIVYAIFTAFASHGILKLMLTRQTRFWVLKIGAIMLVWYGAMYVAEYPYNGTLINVWTKESRVKYYTTSDGQIVIMPIGAESGPEGQALKVIDNATAERYKKQRGRPQSELRTPGLLDRLLGYGDKLYMEVERIDIQPDKTVLHFAVSRTDESRYGRFYQPHGGDYLSDETGQAYNLIQDNAVYSEWVDAKSHERDSWPLFTSGEIARVKEVRPDETYRFTDEYPPLNPDVRHLRLHDSRFGEVDLDYKLKLARVQEDIRKRNEQELARVGQREEKEAQDNATIAAALAAKELEQRAQDTEREEKEAQTRLALATAQAEKEAQARAAEQRAQDREQEERARLSAARFPASAPSASSVPVVRPAIPNSGWIENGTPGPLEIRVNRIRSERGQTVLYLGARSKDRRQDVTMSSAWVNLMHLADQKGGIYRFRGGSRGMIYPADLDGAPSSPIYRYYFPNSNMMRGSEVCMFSLNFDPLRDDVNELTLHTSDHPLMNLNRLLQEIRSSSSNR